MIQIKIVVRQSTVQYIHPVPGGPVAVRCCFLYGHILVVRKWNWCFVQIMASGGIFITFNLYTYLIRFFKQMFC